ncbi:MAG: trigger factor [Calditrichaeota bacterium]|nr:MAG: trigger factor [Calditrichota bacterium]MBL1205044.1 trigger factor [Calditrichota bacterium]NOG44874.1 trigger factor [Calditrichota bacterium]
MVTTEIKKISNCRKELNIVMAKADIEPIREKEILKVRKSVQFPGFRKGKAPLAMIKKSYGQHIEAYTMESAVQDALEKAVTENEIHIVGMPDAKKVDFNDDGDLTMTIEVDTYPDVELKNYKGFEFIKDKYVIEDSFVEENINRLRKQHATKTEAKGKVKDGQIVVIDMQELDQSGAPLKGKKYNDITISIGEGRFDPELEKQIIGLEKDKPTKISKEYPKDYAQKEMAGKKENYEITVKKIETETLPEVNDEFVKKVNPNAKNVEDFREQVSKSIQHDYEKEAENRFSQELSQKLIEENSFDVPDVLVENYLDNVIKDVKQRDPKADENSLREYYRTDSLANMKWHYIKEQVGKDENITVEDKDVEEFLEKIENEEIRKIYKENEAALNEVKHSIKDRKVHDFLVENSKIKENEVKLD